MSLAIKKCPFCGKKASLELTDCTGVEECKNFENCLSIGNYLAVVCDHNKGGCGASSGFASSQEKAIAKWERRAV